MMLAVLSAVLFIAGALPALTLHETWVGEGSGSIYYEGEWIYFWAHWEFDVHVRRSG